MPIFCRGKCPDVEQPAVVGGDVLIENEVVVEEGRNGVLDAAVGGVVGAAEDDDVVEGGDIVIEDEVVEEERNFGPETNLLFISSLTLYSRQWEMGPLFQAQYTQAGLLWQLA